MLAVGPISSSTSGRRSAVGYAVACALAIVLGGSGFAAGSTVIYAAGDIQLASSATDGTPAGFAEIPVVWSPDGTKLLFLTVGVSDPAFDQAGFYAKDLNTGVTTLATADANGQAVPGAMVPAWSPDGTRILFMSLIAGEGWRVFIKNIVTGELNKLTTELGLAGTPSWSPDGTRIAYGANDGQVYVENVHTHTTSVVSALADGTLSNSFSSQAAVWSPDGRQVAFTSGADNLAPDTPRGRNIFIKNLSSGAVSIIPTGFSEPSGPFPVWNATGTKLAVLTNSSLARDDVNGTFDVYVVDVRTGAITFVNHTGTGAPGGDWSGSFLWSPTDPNEIAFLAHRSSGSQIYVEDVSSRSVRPVGTAADGTPGDLGAGPSYSWSPDGGSIAFQSNSTNLIAKPSKKIQIFTKDLNTGAVALVSSRSDGTPGKGSSNISQAENFVPWDRGWSAWSPDGTRIAFKSWFETDLIPDVSGMEIYIKHLASSTPPPPPPPPPPTSRSGPVLMIHGIDHSAPYGDDCAVSWDDAKRYLRANGFADRELLTVAYYERDAHCDRPINNYMSATQGNSYFGGSGAHAGDAGGHTAEAAIEHLGYHLAWFIYDQYASHGISVDILAHSMGGLIARYALAEVEAKNPAFPSLLLVSNVVTLGTPHGGVRQGPLGLCAAIGGLRECSEMTAGSAFLTGLEKNGLNPQGEGGTDWTAMGSDDDNAVAADRAVGTSRNRQSDRYFGGCHKVWYPATRVEGSGRNRRKVKQGIEHSDYQHDGTIEGGMSATDLLTYSSGGHCGAPLEELRGQRHPMGQAALALASADY